MAVREDGETPLQRRSANVCMFSIVVVLITYGIYRLATGEAVIPKKVIPDVVSIRLVEPPPLPPPPPPPPRPKMEEQPKEREMIAPTPLQNVPPPPNNANAAPPGPLALDTQGQGAPDAFGLAGHPGGSDALGNGGGGGAAGSAYGWYASMLESRIQDLLRHDRRLRGQRYEGAVSLRLAADSKLVSVDLIEGTGKRAIDEVVAQVLSEWTPPQPPQGMPQPVIIKLRSY